MSVAKTCTPSDRNLLLIESPIPLAAPVTSAFLPFRPSSGIGGTVEVDRDASHVAGVVGAQGDDQCGGFRDCAYPSHWNLLEGSFGSLLATELENLLQSSAGNDTWGDTIHPHAEAAELERELARKAHHAGLR